MALYSYSKLSTYENCPRLYKFSYVDRIKLAPEAETIEAFMGSRVHEVLKKLYQDLRLSKLNTIEDIMAFYNDAWERNWREDVRIVREEYSPENYRETGAKCIIDYCNRYKPFDQSRTLGLEQMVVIDLEGYKLHGFIDRLAQRGDGHYEIHDYKTSQHLPMQRYFDEDRQLALYQIGVEDAWGDAERVDLIWHYLVHDKEIRSRRSGEDIARVKAETIALIQELEKAEEEDNFPARESELCRWCEYQVLCPKWMHILKTSQMPINKYLQDPGVKLVNEYTRLMEEKREAERKELDEILKGADVWMEVSDLNPYSLSKALARGEWSRELVNKIKEYQRLEESYRLYLSAMDMREEGRGRG